MADRTSLKRGIASTPSAAALGGIIETLGPLNNRWREAPAREKVLTLWDMGDALISVFPKVTDDILWEIQRRSYLTRMLLRYALIVRRGWPERHVLEGLVRELVHYGVFREALPFLKGDRQGIDAVTYQRVVSALGDPSARQATHFIKGLKTAHIGRTRSTGVSAAAAQPHAAAFASALDTLWSRALDGRPGTAVPECARDVVELSQAAVALATGDDRVEAPKSPSRYPDHVQPVAEPLISALTNGREIAAAFRKQAGAGRIMQSADLLNALRSDPALREWRLRNRPAQGSVHSRNASTATADSSSSNS